MALLLYWLPSICAPGRISGGIDPGFPEASSASSRRLAMRDFAGFGRVTTAEMDVDDLLQHGADPELDGP